MSTYFWHFCTFKSFRSKAGEDSFKNQKISLGKENWEAFWYIQYLPSPSSSDYPFTVSNAIWLECCMSMGQTPVHGNVQRWNLKMLPNSVLRSQWSVVIKLQCSSYRVENLPTIRPVISQPMAKSTVSFGQLCFRDLIMPCARMELPFWLAPVRLLPSIELI